MALLANIHRNPDKTSVFTAADFDPYARRARGPEPKVKLKDIKGLLLGLKPTKVEGAR